MFFLSIYQIDLFRVKECVNYKVDFRMLINFQIFFCCLDELYNGYFLFCVIFIYIYKIFKCIWIISYFVELVEIVRYSKMKLQFDLRFI